MSGWGQPLAAGRGRGLAFHLCRGVPVAQVVKVTTTPAGVKIDQVFVAVDAGNFRNCPVLRMQQAPRIVVHVLESGDPIRGVGELEPGG